MTTNIDAAVGVIGVGNMGRHHARVYRELPNTELVGVYDVDTEQAESVAEKCGTIVRELDELLDTADVVSIAVPTEYHHEMATKCIQRGVHTLIEKPFVLSRGEGEELIEMAEENDVTIQVGHIERFNPAVVALRNIIPDLDIISVTARRLGPPLDRQMPDSVVKDLMIHDLDILFWLINEQITSMAAFGGKHEYATVDFQFEDGSIGSLTASRVTQQKVRELEITAQQCQVVIDYIDQTVEIYRHSLPEYIESDGEIRYRHESIVERPMVENTEPLKNEITSFLSSVRTGDEPVVTAEDGLQALEYVFDIEQRIADRNDRKKEIK
ncbi:Gfo/Idh/MocA family oxidoreductase [Haladaptatus sp. DYF46]|uniref:Gfo/Idh/MocA family protein n=1 Tax=Haladaptatus sp. DYF46 TaxID=2886041 RepID=UPI001E61DAD1|nr:Gfo/Idh/MocA family oxidoreductase [Haladaptatus sp. DYF46]